MKKSTTVYQSQTKRKVIYYQTRHKRVTNIFILQINLTKKIRIGVCCMAKKVTNLKLFITVNYIQMEHKFTHLTRSMPSDMSEIISGSLLMSDVFTAENLDVLK